MIIPALPAAAAVTYSGGTPSTSRPGFGTALTARLAELQTMTPGAQEAHRHHHAGQGTGIVNQDAGNGMASAGPGSLAGTAGLG